jgi:hypothetical protein
MSSAVRITALLLTACMLTGCGDGDKPESDPSRSPSTSAGPTDGPTPTDGLRIEQPTFSFRLPVPWQENTPSLVGNVSTVGGGPVDGWDFTDITVQTWTKRNFDDATKPSGDVLENFFSVTAKKRKSVETTEWAGQPAYHFTGTGSVAGYAEQFGVIWKGQHIAIVFDFPSPAAAAGHWRGHVITAAQRQALIDSVEASWQWS